MRNKLAYIAFRNVNEKIGPKWPKLKKPKKKMTMGQKHLTY